MSKQPKIRMVELEQRLADDTSGACRDQLCESLHSEAARLKRGMDAGLPPEEFEKARQVAAALNQAAAVVERYWRLEHGNAT